MTDYYVDGAVGGDGNAGTSEGSGNAWATIDFAHSTVVAGDRIFVKASATYSELVTLDTAGTRPLPIETIGYTTTIADGGKVTIAAADTRASCIASSLATGFHIFRNCIFTNATGNCVNLGTGGDNFIFINCEFSGAGVRGILGDNLIGCIQCTFFDNASGAVSVDSNGYFQACEFNANSVSATQIDLVDGDVRDCIFYGLGSGSTAVDFTGSAGGSVVNCGIDGEGAGTGTGVEFSNGACNRSVVSNTWFHDIATAVVTNGDFSSNLILMNNGYSTVGAVSTGTTAPTNLNGVTGTMGFTNEAGDDYSIASAGGAENAGIDASDA